MNHAIIYGEEEKAKTIRDKLDDQLDQENIKKYLAHDDNKQDFQYIFMRKIKEISLARKA